MRKLLPLILALCLIMLALPALAGAYPTTTPISGYTLRPAADEVRVYATPSIKANIVGYILPDDSQEVHVLEVTGNWCFVRFTSIQGISYGYVPLSCFDVAAKATPTPAPQPGTAFAPGTAAWVVNRQEGYRLNLRAEPAYTASSFGAYYTGTPVTLMGEIQDGFAQVLLAGTLGWMDVRYLTTDPLGFVPEMPQLTVHNPGSGAVLRSGPTSESSRVGWYAHGTEIYILGVRTDGWYFVTADESFGYMAASVLSGTLPSGYGMDSDNPALDNSTNESAVYYINTRSNDGMLNLRKSASTSAKSLGLFYTGTPLTVLSYTRSGWAYVRIGQTEGYLDVDYLTTTPPTQYGAERIIRNSSGTGLNLRTEPSTGGALLTFLPNYTRVTVLGQLSNDWCYVSYNGLVGYMLGNSLKPVN